MSRRPRLVLPGVPLHVIQRGINRQDCFFAAQDRQLYLEILQDAAELHGCALHAYVLMTNHVHLLLTPETAEGAGGLMKQLGQNYVQYVNRAYRRSGTLWEGRFRSCLVQEETYLLQCYRYIELNPVRAGLVRSPGDHPWSSYPANALGHGDPLVTPHPLYLALGRSAPARQGSYRGLFRGRLPGDFLEAVRASTNGNYALGDRGFLARTARRLGRRTAPGKSGRPRKTQD